MLLRSSNAVFSSSATESVLAFTQSHLLTPPQTPLSLDFFSVATSANGLHRKLHLRHSSSSSSSSKLFNLILACRASRDSHETTSSLRKDDDSPLHGLSEMIVGVLGGGQLGRMLCQAASKMAVKVMVLDPSDNCPASALAYDHMVGSLMTVQLFKNLQKDVEF